MNEDDGQWLSRIGLVTYPEMSIEQIRYALSKLRDVMHSSYSSKQKKEWALNKSNAIGCELSDRGYTYVDSYTREREGHIEFVSGYTRVGHNPIRRFRGR